MKIFCYLIPILIRSSYGFPDDRIVGGIDAPTRIKHQVSLLNNLGRHACGGSLLNKNWILTAAHCLRTNLESVGYGSNSLLDLTKCGINKTFIHSQNNGNPFYNFDVGLVKVDCDINANDNVSYVTLPIYGLNVGASLTVTGWGLLNFPGSLPDKLQQLTTRYIGSDECARLLAITVPESAMCTLTKLGEGVCMGDSGGGLVDDVTAASPIIYGIVSGSVPCARGYPDLFARVFEPSVNSWITDTINAN